MGKQINYWMEYESFLLLAQRAVELGCTIIKEDAGKVVERADAGIVTPDCRCYYFHLPEAGAAAVGYVTGYGPYVLVAAVVAVTGGLLRAFYGKKQKKATE